MPFRHPPETVERAITLLAATHRRSTAAAKLSTQDDGPPLSERTLRYWNRKYAERIEQRIREREPIERERRNRIVDEIIRQLPPPDPAAWMAAQRQHMGANYDRFRRAYPDYFPHRELPQDFPEARVSPTLQAAHDADNALTRTSRPRGRQPDPQTLEHGLRALARWAGNSLVASEQLADQGHTIPDRTLRDWKRRYPHQIAYYWLDEMRTQLPELRCARTYYALQRCADLDAISAQVMEGDYRAYRKYQKRNKDRERARERRAEQRQWA